MIRTWKKLWGMDVRLAVILAVSVAIVVPQSRGWADETTSVQQDVSLQETSPETLLEEAKASPETQAVDTSEASQESEDVDPNLVPLEPELEPELTASPSEADMPETEDKGEAPKEDVVDAVEAERKEDLGPVYNIPVVFDQTVQSHIRFFNTSIRDRFEQWLLRLNRYRPLVEDIFAEFDLPSDLVHLSLVESGFNPYAYSRAKATGPWQFMKGTGKIYGLRIDHYVDERRDPIKSTIAAARYLRDLYDLFGTWPLAMAAYNAGEGKVLRALNKAQAESFSEISRTKHIRRETKQYVPRIMAATIIARNLDQYGFNHVPVAPHEFEEVIVTRPLHFRAISNVTGIPYDELRLLNPELRRDATPPGDTAYHLKVPVGTSPKVIKLLERVPTHKFAKVSPERTQVRKTRQTRQGKISSSQWYRVRGGDTLGKISRRFGIPIQTLKARNNLSSSLIRAGDLLNIAR
ncbi:MAG: transglycosylase SLT domain-containing protein [Nitrospira sp.]|nr:transglycosylase SLT domain-containing protein [Nitrospira sp.]